MTDCSCYRCAKARANAALALRDQRDMGTAQSCLPVCEGTPDGWRLVPVEPTEAMLVAACEIGPDTNSGCFSDDDARSTYRAMLAAAPPPPEKTEGWRTMESAPKDGTLLLLIYKGRPIVAAHNGSDKYPFWNSETVGISDIANFTHWQPLPPPPENNPSGIAPNPSLSGEEG